MKQVFLKMYLKKNLGDDLFLDCISNRYPDTKFFVDVPASDLRSFHLKNVFGRSFTSRVMKKLFKKSRCGDRYYDAEIVLGGSMFIEKSLSMNLLNKEIEKKYGVAKPLFVLGANFGPYKNEYYFDKYKRVFSKAVDVCFREEYSANLFKDLKNVRVAPDIMFGLDNLKQSIEEKRKIVISVIDLKKKNELASCKEKYENKISQIALYYAMSGHEVVLMSFCKYEGDEDVVKRILKKTKHRSVKAHYYRGNIKKALEEIASSEIIIGTRFHSIVLGLVFGKKVLPIIYSDKTKNMLEDIEYKGKVLDIDNMDSLDISHIDSYISTFKNTNVLRKESQKHFEKLDDFLGEGK
jgi:colanic acid/amylovoran biosynthesis protein